MPDNVKLFNKGLRTITGEGFVLGPQQAMSFEPETGAKLKKLYADELVSMEDIQRQFEPTPAVEAPAKPAEASKVEKTAEPETEANAEAAAKEPGAAARALGFVKGIVTRGTEPAADSVPGAQS